MQRSTSRPSATAMIVRRALHDRQSNSHYHTYPQVDFRKNSMGGVSKTFGCSRRGDVLMIDTDASSQKRVSKALFQDNMQVQAIDSCARRSLAAWRSGVSNPSVNQAYTLLSCCLASADRFCAIHVRLLARFVAAGSCRSGKILHPIPAWFYRDSCVLCEFMNGQR